MGQPPAKNAERPLLLEIRSSRWFILTVVALAGGVDMFMYGMISPVTPTALRDRVGLRQDQVQNWTSILLSLFAASLLTTSPVIGFVSDRAQSRKWPYIVGVLGLAAATALLCAGTHLGLWIAGRLCQGIAASIVWVVGVALIVDTVGKDGLTEAIGYLSMSTSLGTLAGPLLGGVLYEQAGYYAVYGLAFGLIATDFILRLVMIEKKHAARWTAEEQTATHPHPAPATAAKRLATLLRSRRLLVTVWANFTISMIITSFDSVLPIFVHETFGWRQTAQGLIFVPLMVPHIVGPATGAILDRYPQSSRYCASGAFLIATPLLVLLRLVTDNTLQHKVLLCALLALLGVCIAVALPPVDAEAFHAISAIEAHDPHIFGPGGAMASAFGFTAVGFASGGLIGPYFAGFIRENAGWGTMGWALGLMSGVSSIPVLLFMGGWVIKPNQTEREHASRS